MGKKVLIIGESGTGKSASMRNFTKDEVLIINVASKDLPFREPKGGFEKIATDSYREIKRAIQNTKKKVIVIDDAQYLMANEFMRRSSEKGFDKFTEIGYNFWDLQQIINTLPNDVIVYQLSHLDRDQNGNEKVKTIGKLLDEKITVEGMFSIVLKTIVQDGKYYFQTQNSGHDTCKSPIGLFDAILVDNDLKAVDRALRDYYDLVSTNDEQAAATVKQANEPIIEDKPRTLAEKVADFKNQEPDVVELPKRKTRTRNVETTTEQEVVEQKEEATITTETTDDATTPRRRRRKVATSVDEIDMNKIPF